MRKLKAALALALLGILPACLTHPTSGPAVVESAPVETPANVPQATISLGTISDDPTENILQWTPLMSYLADRLTEFGIGAGDVVITDDPLVMAEWIKTGKADLVIDSFLSTALVEDISGAPTVLYRDKKKPDKRAVFFALASSDIGRVEDLQGHVIAFDDPESASGFMLPAVYLIERGLDIVEKATAGSKVSAAEIGYVFAQEDEAAIRWVADGKTVVAAVDNETFEEFDTDNPGLFKVIAVTDPLFRDQPLLASPSMDESLIQAIRTILIQMGESEEGRAILDDLKTIEFADLDSERMGDLERATDIFHILQQYLN